MEKKKKVCIVGCAKSKNEVPFKDESFEFWGVNNLFLTPEMKDRKWDRWFEIHFISQDEHGRYLRRFNLDFRGQPVNDYLVQLGQTNIPVYMQKKWDMVPTAVEYPVNEMLKRFPRGYFTNSISWMIALAIHEGFEEIHIYGVDMAVASEYNHQRPSCEYFIGIAEGLGIKVAIPETADLLKTRLLYGFQEEKASMWRKKVDVMISNVRTQRDKAEHELRMAQKKSDQAVGAEMALIEANKIWD